MYDIKMVLIVILSVMTAGTQGIPPDSFLVTAPTPFLLMYVVWSQLQGQDHYYSCKRSIGLHNHGEGPHLCYGNPWYVDVKLGRQCKGHN